MSSSVFAVRLVGERADVNKEQALSCWCGALKGSGSGWSSRGPEWQAVAAEIRLEHRPFGRAESDF